MYNERERLMHHQQLLSPGTAAADLLLLSQLRPNHPRLNEFRIAPDRHADAILYELLGVASRGDIVKNRMQAAPKVTEVPAAVETTEVPGDKPSPDTEEATDVTEAPSPAPAKKKATDGSKKKKNTQK